MYNNQLIQIFLGLTYRCNLNCKHCYVEKRQHQEMPYKMIKDLLDELSDLGVFKIVFSHGESILRSDFFKIIEYCNKLDLVTTLLTNGTLLDERMVAKLKEGKISKILISLDSLDRKYLNKLRGRDNILDKVTNAMHFLFRDKINFGLNVTLNESSIKMLEEIISVAMENGASEVNFLTLRPSSDKSKKVDKKKWESYSKTIKEIRRLKLKYINKINIGFHDPLSIKILEKETTKKDFKDLILENECQAGRLWMSIQPSGDIQPCNFLPIIVGNLWKKSFKEIYKEKKAYNTISEKCAQCSVKKYCKGGCRSFSYFAQGDKDYDPRCINI